ncbi:MAG: hypothetical protein ABW292_18745 [Vicinamibacterales bacterium]
MQDDHTGSDWKRMPDEYFQSRDLRLFERQRRQAEAQAELQAMAEAIGLPVHDEILLDLRLVDYDAVTIVLLELTPAILTAWADRNVSTRERDIVLQMAARDRVPREGPACVQLAKWLDCYPSNRFFHVSLQAIGVMLAALEPEARASLRRKVLNDCARVAAASRGPFDWGHMISTDEQQLINHIAVALS